MINIEFEILGKGTTTIEAHAGSFLRALVEIVADKDRKLKFQLSPQVIRFSELESGVQFPVLVETSEDPGSVFLKLHVTTEDSVISIRVPGFGEHLVGRNSFAALEYVRTAAALHTAEPPAS